VDGLGLINKLEAREYRTSPNANEYSKSCIQCKRKGCCGVWYQQEPTGRVGSVRLRGKVILGEATWEHQEWLEKCMLWGHRLIYFGGWVHVVKFQESNF
jgi:hypothetical protein